MIYHRGMKNNQRVMVKGYPSLTVPPCMALQPKFMVRLLNHGNSIFLAVDNTTVHVCIHDITVNNSASISFVCVASNGTKSKVSNIC